MRPVYDTKEFLALEPEDKIKIINLELSKFEDVNFENLIEELKQEESTLVLKLSSLKDQMAEFTKNGLDMSNVEKLALVKNELEELRKKAGQFKQKSADLDKHKNALELKNLIAKKSSLDAEIKELQDTLETLREQKIESQNSVVEIRANYDNFYSSYNDEIARLMVEEKKVFETSINDTSEDLINDRFKLEEQLKNKKDEIIKIKENIERLTEKCLAVENDITEKQELLGSIVVPQESKELIVQAKDLESEIIIFDDMLKRIDKLIDSNKEELEIVKAKYSNELKTERKIEEDLNKIKASTSKIFENSDMTEFQKLRNCDKTLDNFKKVEIEILNFDKKIEEIKGKINNKLSKIENIKVELSKAEEIYNQKTEYLKSLKVELLKLQETREELLGNNCLGMITQYTSIGDFCPVCRTRVTQKNHVEVMDLTGIEREIDMQKSKVSYAEKDLNNAYANIVTIRSMQEYENSIIETYGQEINTIKGLKTKIYQQVVDINDKTEENFVNIKSALEKTSETLEDVINLQNKLQITVQENKDKKIEYGTKISMLSELEEQLIDLYYVLQKERAEREMLMLEAKCNVSVDNFEEKRTNLAETELQSNQLNQELIELYLQLSELKNQILASQEDLSQLEYERGVIETKLQYSSTTNNTLSNDDFVSYNSESVREKIDALHETHKHLLSLKQDAENSLQNTLKEYDVKTKLLAFKIDERQDVSALVSSLIYRYSFKDENEVKEYIITDNMLKLKENEIKSYNLLLSKLELQHDYLSENSSPSENSGFCNYLNLSKECESINIRLGELKILIENKEKEFNEYNQLKELIEKYK